MKNNTNKPISAAMRFGECWTGTYLVGDDAYAYAAALRRILKKNSSNEVVGVLDRYDLAILEGLAATLEASREDGELPEIKDTQMMKEFSECVRPGTDDFELSVEEL